MNATSFYWSSLLYIDSLSILYYLLALTILTQPPEWNSEAAAEEVLKIMKISQENNCVGFSQSLSVSLSASLSLCVSVSLSVSVSLCLSLSLSYKVASLQACNVTTQRLLPKCFLVKSEKFLRTPILKNIWKTVSVYWLLHHILIFTILYSTQTIELMMREAVSFEEVFHWTKFLAFES